MDPSLSPLYHHSQELSFLNMTLPLNRDAVQEMTKSCLAVILPVMSLLISALSSQRIRKCLDCNWPTIACEV